MASIFLPVDQAYDRWSTFYDSYENPMVFMASEIVHRSLSNVEGLDIFEFGCGTGRNLAALENLGAKTLTGCDFSEGMLAMARAKSSNLRLFQHDMSRPIPSIPDESADVVLFCLTLEHVENLVLPLREARRIVRPQGRVSVIEIHPFLSLSGLAAHFDVGNEDEIRMPAYPHQFQNYFRAADEAGLTIAQCREWRPADIGNPIQLQHLKRGPDFPLTLEFELTRA